MFGLTKWIKFLADRVEPVTNVGYLVTVGQGYVRSRYYFDQSDIRDVEFYRGEKRQLVIKKSALRKKGLI